MATLFKILLLHFVMFNTSAEFVEYALHKKLLDGYNKTILPVENAGEAVVVGLQPEIFSLIQIDERTGTIKYMQWLELTWKDQSLRWDPVQYENVHLTYIPVQQIWQPDIAIYNQRDEIKYPLPLDNNMAEIFFDGTVLVEMLQTVEISCQEFDVTEFPFDTQTCTTRYASWNRGNQELILTTDVVQDNEEQFNPHTEWELLSFQPSFDDIKVNYTTLLNLNSTDGSVIIFDRVAVFDEVHYDLKIRRKPHYYIYTLVIPSVAVTILCIIGLFAPFDASGNREEKVTLGLTTMLSMIMILMIVGESMPRSTGNRPLLGTFILFEIGLSTVATVVSAVILIMHNRVELSAITPPACVVRFTYFILRIKHRTDHNVHNDVFQSTRAQTNKEPVSNNTENLVVSDFENGAEDVKAATPTDEERRRAEHFSFACEQTLTQLKNQTQNISYKLAYKSAKRKWIHIFRLVDWICMFLFIFVHLGVTIYLFQ